MGDELVNGQTNSGHGACEITRGGKRSDGVKMVEQICRKYPGIDSFCGSCVLAGIQVEKRGGQYHLIGRSHNLTPDELAKVIKFQARFNDAVKKTVIVETVRTFNRPVKSTGYRVAGGGVFPDPNLPKGIGKKPIVPQPQPARRDKSIGMLGDGVEDKPESKVGAPNGGFASFLSDD